MFSLKVFVKFGDNNIICIHHYFVIYFLWKLGRASFNKNSLIKGAIRLQNQKITIML